MPGPQTPKIQTLRQAKKAYSKRPASYVSEAEKRAIFQRAARDERAAEFREKERKRIENKKKKAEKEQRSRETQRRLGRTGLQNDADDGDRVTGKWGVLGSQLKLNFNMALNTGKKRRAGEMEEDHDDTDKATSAKKDTPPSMRETEEDAHEIKESAERLGYDMAKRLPQLERLLPKPTQRPPSSTILVKGASFVTLPDTTRLADTTISRKHVGDSFGPDYDTPPMGQGTAKTSTTAKTTQPPSTEAQARAREIDLNLLAAIPSSQFDQLSSSPAAPSTFSGITSHASSPKHDTVKEIDLLNDELDEDTNWMDAVEGDELSLIGELLNQLSQTDMPLPASPRHSTSANFLTPSSIAVPAKTEAVPPFTFGSQWVATQDLLALEQEADE